MSPGTTIFEHMSGLARAHGAVNLGQGFPDFGWPQDVIDKAAAALTGAASQYPPMRGIPELRQAVADHYRAHQGLELSADEVIVTSGATEALAAALLALIEPGDEVLLFQPLYDSYLPMVRRAGGVPKLVRLAPPDWKLTAEAIEAAITPKTRLMVFNNPHNPAAVAFDRGQLQLLADACVRHDLIAVSDEVWEHVVFDGRRHVPLMALPGMRERTVKVGSAGKIFSLTGWKVGWLVAAPGLAERVARSHQFLTFTTPPNLQTAAAYGLGKDRGYFDDMRAALQRSRDRLAAGLVEIGYVPLASQGSYFLSVDLPVSGIDADDVSFCERIVREAGVAAIPVSAFYAEDPVRHVVRLCFAKADATLDAGLEGLARARTLFA
ncbi:aminotransferase [Sphingoaurantiacus capsulatus]|uniref:Aminotransferase n=1 Tax=Sphingoaurantiacus capsulatus TaxID=1771310 RepID=A0ABV7XAV2_9SPHN